MLRAANYIKKFSPRALALRETLHRATSFNRENVKELSELKRATTNNSRFTFNKMSTVTCKNLGTEIALSKENGRATCD